MFMDCSVMDSIESPEIPEIVWILTHFGQLDYHLLSRECISMEDHINRSFQVISVLIGLKRYFN